MKTFNRYRKAWVIGLCLLNCSMLFSCKKALDNELQNGTYENEYWKSESDVDGAVVGAYSLLRKSLFQDNAFFIWGDGPVGVFNTDDTNVSSMYGSGSFNVPYREQGAHNWTNWYQVVGLANLILEKVEAMPNEKFAPGRKEQLQGEAYFLRALAYFYMTRAWGDLPLQLKAITTADQAEKIGRTPEADIMKQIMKDAQRASSLLTWQAALDNQRIRASKGAAMALLTHASAWENDYDKTALYADSLLSQGALFRLQPKGSITKLFDNSNESENIFVITTKFANNEASANSTIAYLTISSDFINGLPNKNPTYWLSPTAITELYTTDDARKAEFIGYRNAADLKPNLLKYKYFVNAGAGGQNDLRAESNIIIFRLADIILLKAEALNALNRDAEALEEINKVRTRSGVAPVSLAGTLLKREIVLERRRELLGEGHNYFDMVRNSRDLANGGPSFYPTWMTRERFDKQGWRWPILNTIINGNRLINQNEWWKGRY